MEYTNRLAAALRDRGASTEFIREAVHDVEQHRPNDYVEEFGEAEDYAELIYPNRTKRMKYGFILTGVISGLLIAFGARFVEPFWDNQIIDQISPWSPLIGLTFILSGIIVQWLMYIIQD